MNNVGHIGLFFGQSRCSTFIVKYDGTFCVDADGVVSISLESTAERIFRRARVSKIHSVHSCTSCRTCDSKDLKKRIVITATVTSM